MQQLEQQHRVASVVALVRQLALWRWLPVVASASAHTRVPEPKVFVLPVRPVARRNELTASMRCEPTTTTESRSGFAFALIGATKLPSVSVPDGLVVDRWPRLRDVIIAEVGVRST